MGNNEYNIGLLSQGLVMIVNVNSVCKSTMIQFGRVGETVRENNRQQNLATRCAEGAFIICIYTSTLLISRSEVDVLCVLFWAQPASQVQNHNTRNIYL